MPAAALEVVAAPDHADDADDAEERPAEAAELPRELDPRFGQRWDIPGHCGSASLDVLARRAEVLRRMSPVRSMGVTLYDDGSSSEDALIGVAIALLRARERASLLLGSDASQPFPPVFLYPDAELLRSTACLGIDAEGYYDGSIHVNADSSLSIEHVRQTATHEYVHHALRTLGIRTPMWLHEGLAMYVAEERWWSDRRLGLIDWARAQHLPFDAMVHASPHSADSKFAIASYFQSYLMVELIVDRGGPHQLRMLVQELSSGALPASQAFVWAIGLEGDALERAWSERAARLE